MGISFDFDADAGTVDIEGIASNDDMGKVTIQVNSLMYRFQELSTIDFDKLTEEEETELNILEQFVEKREDDEEDY